MNLTPFAVGVQLLLVVVAAAAAASDVDDDAVALGADLAAQWSHFQRQHTKHYADPAAAAIRMRIFAANLRRVRLHNRAYARGDSTFRMAINEMSDQLPDEVNAARGCDRQTIDGGGGDGLSVNDSTSAVPGGRVRAPASVNWVTDGAVTAVRNQGACKSCWAFSAAAALESHHYRKTGRLVTLSTQQLVDCAFSGGCEQGFDKSAAFDYVRGAGGIETDAAYPYEAKTGRCRFEAQHVRATCKGFQSVGIGE